jgi:hypothetical protein
VAGSSDVHVPFFLVQIPVQAVVDCDPDWVVLCPCGLDLDAAEAEAVGIATAPWWKGLRAVRQSVWRWGTPLAPFTLQQSRLQKLEWLRVGCEKATWFLFLDVAWQTG